MTWAIFLAVAIAVVVAVIAGAYLLRSRRRGDGAGPDDVGPSTLSPPAEKPPQPKPKPKAPATRAPEPTAEEVERLVKEAEQILREAGPGAEGETEGEPKPPPEEGAEDGQKATGVGLLEPEPALEEAVEEVLEESLEVIERPTFRERLGRARKAFTERINDIRLRRKIDDDVWDDLEETLILADVGAELASDLVEEARGRAGESRAETASDVVDALKEVLETRLDGRDRSLHTNVDGPTVWLVVGVNGTGKTTTIGKIANLRSAGGDSVVMAAADTFRAAAADQLEIWASRSGAEVVRGQEGSDPSAVVFDAVSLTRTRERDLLLVDTAGRLHTKVNLMEELKKIRRTAEKAGGNPQEVLLVLDATTGQNGLHQAREFAGAAGVTGVVLTKLDGTAKGGIAFAIEQEFGIPIKLVGLGEQAEDLVPFDPAEFVDALFSS